MTIKIQRYNEEKKSDWDKFVLESSNGTIFHLRSFLSYHIDRNFNDHSLIINNNNNIIAVFSAAEIYNNNSKILYSHPGSSFGGIILKNNLSFKIINSLIQSIDEYCIQKSFNTLFQISSPMIYNSYQDSSLEYLLQWNKYSIKELYISHAVNLDSFNIIDTIISKRKRRYLNNDTNLKEFKFTQSKDIDTFYKILVENKKRFNITPTHSIQEMMHLIQLFPNKIQLYVSSIGNQITGGSLLFHANKNASLVFYNVVLDKYRNSQLSMYQLYQCMKVVKEKNINILDFGVSHIPESENPLSPKFSLIQFKEQLGAKGIIRRAFQKDFILE